MDETIINPDIKKTFPWKLAVIFLLFSVVIIIMGSYYYRYEKNRIFEEQENNLSAIAALKIGQIQQWHLERLTDAFVIKDNRLFIRNIKQYLYDKNSVLKDELLYWMQSVSRGTDYFNVLLTDTTFKVRLSFLKSDTVAGEVIEHDLQRVLKEQNIIMTDLHRSSYVRNLHMDILIPLYDSLQKKRISVGIIILRIDPEKTLFPLIQSWPTPSKSSETLLIRKEGDSVIFLNELRHRHNTSLNLRLPLIESLPASMAVNGVTGLVEGRDYRNIPVVAWLANVPGFPWYMVAKTDKEEILAPFKRYSAITVMVIILLILINASIFGFWIWQQRIKFYRSQIKNEVSLRESEERFRSLYENVTIGIYRTTLEGRIMMANPAMVSMLGFDTFEQLAQRNLQEEGYEPDYPRSKFLESIERDGRIIGLESAWKQKNGKTLIVRESANAVRDAGGRILYYDGTVEDITERRKIEEALRENEKRLREAQDMAHLGFWLWDIKTGSVEWSDEVFKIFCLDPATFKPQIDSILELSPWPEENQRDKELINRAIESHYPGTYEQRFLRPDKSIGYYYSTFRGNYDNNGNLVSIVGTILDITERKKAEEILRESETKFMRLIKFAPLPLCYIDKDGYISLRNDRFIKVFGYDETDVPGLSEWWLKAYPDPEYRKRVIKNWNDAVVKATKNSADIQSDEYLVTCKDGSVRTIIISGITIGENLLATFIDITERKKAEDALRESEDKFKYIFEHSALGNSITHPNGETHFNNAFCEMLGYSEGELVKMKWQDFTHPDDFEITQKVFDTLVSRESDSPRFIKRYLRKDGSVMWADVSTSLRYDKDNEPLYFMTTVNDITELKLAEEVLRNDEKRFRELIEALPQLYWTCRVDGPCDYLSRQWVEYTGIPEADQLGYRWLEQLHSEDREKTITAWAEKVKTGTSFDFEFRIRRYDGEYHWFKTRAIPIHDSESRLIRWLGSNTDIDSIRKAEDQLRNYSKDLEQRVILRTEQLEAANKELEAFSYSVSHDLRAPLRSVHGFTKILLEDYEANLDEEGKRICGIISSSATQMGELIDDLLSFSRIGRSNMNPSEIDMKKMVRGGFEGMTSPSERKRIKLNIGKLQKAFGDVTLFGQVWTNLISNAIKYSSKNDVPEISIGSKIAGDMIIYFIKDNGVGFDMQYSHKLFGVFQRLHSEADFEGNGVGLAIVKRIVLKHGGKVWAEGEVGKGATFYFSLPAEGTGQRATGDRRTKGQTPDA